MILDGCQSDRHFPRDLLLLLLVKVCSCGSDMTQAKSGSSDITSMLEATAIAPKDRLTPFHSSVCSAITEKLFHSLCFIRAIIDRVTLAVLGTVRTYVEYSFLSDSSESKHLFNYK